MHRPKPGEINVRKPLDLVSWGEATENQLKLKTARRGELAVIIEFAVMLGGPVAEAGEVGFPS